MRRSAIAAALLTALTLAACGSTNPGDTSDSSVSSGQASSTVTVPSIPTVAPPADTNTSTTPTVATTASVPATVTTATITQPNSGGAGLTTETTAASAECVGADLSASAVPPNGATGTVVLGFILKNTSSGACSTYGWPGVAFVNSGGSVVATQTTRTSSDILGSTPPTRFTIPAGAQASFRVTVHDSNDQGGEGGCGSYSTVQIIAPNDTATMRVKLPNGPAEVCGSAAVSPLETGTSATGQ
jgi:hypothetical protein